jgi:putative IMPACT (imprinted ancient) family translation regulator
MLTVLLGSGVGNVAAVVTRYFGGTKLGKGGLARAYSGTLKQALEGLPVEELVARVKLEVTVGFPLLASVRRILPEFEATVEAEKYTADVVLSIVLPEENVDSFQSALAGVTGGRARAARP